MQKLITTCCLTCTLLSAGFSTEPAPAFRLADSLQQAGEFRWASSEYERVVYRADDNRERTVALLKKAECLLALNEPGDAYKTTNRVYYAGLHDSLHYASRYKSAFYAFLSKDFELATSELLLIEQFLPDSMAMQASILYALSLNELRDWETARKKLVNWTNYAYADAPALRDSLLARIDVLYDPKEYPKYKDPQKAELLSSLVPGLGQLYPGRFWDAAFNAGMVLAGLGVGAYGILVAHYYVAGGVLGYAIFQRFYSAGVNRANFLARKYNHETLRAYNDRLMEQLLGFDRLQRGKP